MDNDPLLHRSVTINADATTLRGMHHPKAGHTGVIMGRTPGGFKFKVEFGQPNGDSDTATFAMADFTVHPGSESTAGAVDTTHILDIDAMVPSRTNPRTVFDQEELHSLAATIKAQGIAQPILVRKLPGSRLQDTFEDHATRHATHEIVAGERRWRAAAIAGLRRVPVLVRNLTDAQVLILQLIENIQRKELSPLDEGRGYQRLIDEQGYTAAAVAEAMDKKTTYVYEALRLPQLCDEAKTAIQQGTLKRSVALLVAQRPTMPLQIEFTKRVLTTGPDNGPLSYRAAKDLAHRSYQTALEGAPFQLTDADLCPKAGACTQCIKRTGASPELWDKTSADVCTDTACFAEKKEAHYERITLQAKQQGRKVITGREAREIMPTDNASPAGYILLDKPRTDAEAPMRTALGKAVPQGKVVLIETPSGHMVEAIPTRAAGAALEAQGKQEKPAKGKGAVEPSREELEEAYQLRWREASVLATIDGLRIHAEPEDLDALPAITAYRAMICLARETDDKCLCAIFNLTAGFDDADLVQAVRSAAEQAPRIHNMVLMMLAAAVDIEPLFDRPKDEALQLEGLAPIAGVNLAGIKATIQAEMKAEAADRAAAAATAAAPTDKAKPTLKPKADKPAKTSKADAQFAIAQALRAQPTTENDFIEGQHVRVRIDLKNHKGKLLMTKGLLAELISKTGDRAWMLTVPDVPGATRLIADYTELEAL